MIRQRLIWAWALSSVAIWPKIFLKFRRKNGLIWPIKAENSVCLFWVNVSTAGINIRIIRSALPQFTLLRKITVLIQCNRLWIWGLTDIRMQYSAIRARLNRLLSLKQENLLPLWLRILQLSIRVSLKHNILLARFQPTTLLSVQSKRRKTATK